MSNQMCDCVYSYGTISLLLTVLSSESTGIDVKKDEN